MNKTDIETIEGKCAMQDSRIKLWDEFLENWPLSSVEQMTLDEYTGFSSSDSFSHWLEFKSRPLGSIRGGSAFKFGVYRRANTEPVEAKQGRRYDDQYAWYARLGETAQEAFERVKAAILSTIKHVQEGDLDAVDQDKTLGLVLKWKIAFLYQDRQNLICPPIYNEDMLRYGSRLDKNATHADMVREIMSKYDGTETILQFCAKIWKPYNEQFANWFPKDYDPGFSTEDWVEMLNDRELFRDPEDLKVMKRMKHFGGEATCKQLALEYGGNFNHYNAVSASLAERIHKQTKCPVLKEGENENARWWPILYFGRRAGKETPGVYIWKLRPELSVALDQINLDHIPLYEPKTEPGYWILVASQNQWGTSIQAKSASDFNVGDIQDYDWKSEKRYRPYLKEMVMVGDKVLCYETAPSSQLVGCFEVSERDVQNEKTYFKKTADLARRLAFSDLNKISDLPTFSSATNLQNAIVPITKEEYELLLKLCNPSAHEKYDLDRLYEELWMSRDDVDSLFHLIGHKKNVILQGAPGVGKTFAAKRLAYAMMGQKDESRIEMIQFHQNYSYEDFMMGYKPEEDGFKLKEGVFYRFCQKAENDPGNDYFFIIDEINRGNMSKIFGELLMLIEKDYRGIKATLAYGDTSFSVPENLYIIGMMNTADRSLAMIDYALRRRFSFFEMTPGFDSDGFKRKLGSNDATFNKLIGRIKELNENISQDDSLGSGFRIGHSYFSDEASYTDERLKAIVNYDIVPMLQEYWFDDKQKWQDWKDKLIGVFK